MEIRWTATIDGQPEPRLDAYLWVHEEGPLPGLLRALECEMHYLMTKDLPEAVYEVMKGRWS